MTDLQIEINRKIADACPRERHDQRYFAVQEIIRQHYGDPHPWVSMNDDPALMEIYNHIKGTT